ncbi:sensor histidine kinase [Agromyces sp. SYSU T00194]|uniref:sensor histidine kinase n=1 Tax=Agromyces chitinivorans TaxID=3158560 RepID=UPI0033983155
MHQTLTDRWSRVSLRSKITGVTVLMLTLGLLVSGVGTMTMLGGWVEDQQDKKLEAIARGDLEKYFVGGDAGTTLEGEDLRLDTTDDVFIAVYDGEGAFVAHNWLLHDRDSWPEIPSELTLTDVALLNSGSGYTVRTLNDVNGDPNFHAIALVATADQHGNFAPVLVAVSMTESRNLLAAYLTIFLGFGIGVVLVGALLTRMLVTTTFAPLREVEHTAAAIADGDFSQRLGGATPNTEVGRLNRSLNTMLNRIDRAFRDRARTIDQMRRFVGDASHELRTPLVSVRGYAELYRMGALQSPDDVGQAMDRIEKEAIRMGGLVEDLLELARLDETKPLALARVDLLPLARDAALDAMAISQGRTVSVLARGIDGDETTDATSLPSRQQGDAASRPATGSGPIAFAGATLARLRRRPRRGVTPDAASVAEPEPLFDLEGADADLSDDLPEAVPAIVMAEENKLRQVITNLMANAMRFTPDDSPIEIVVSTDRASESATIEIVDHGEGIPPQIREKIFQRFWRADTSRTRETGGSGLGLAIVASIVAAHNGAVGVVETPGGGATFRVTLPLADSARAPRSLAAGDTPA